MLDAGLIVGGLALLYFGAEWLVGAASRLAASFGIRPLLIGLTVVAYGTSAPELVVGIGAAIRGQGAIALGNVVGSNIANLGLILAVAALIAPPAIDPSLRRRELPALLATTALVPLSLLDGRVAPWEAAGLLCLGAGYTTWMVWGARAEAPVVAAAAEMAAAADRAGLGAVPGRANRLRLGGLILVGLALLVVGGHLLVEGAVGVARSFGLSDRLIGLTIIAVGTSLPELATSVIAAIRGHADIAVGNVIGSNIFNVVLILGASGLGGSIDAPLAKVALDLVALGLLTGFAGLVLALRRRVSRLTALSLLLAYVAFLVALALF